MRLIGQNSCSTYSTKSKIWHGEAYELVNLDFTPKFDLKKIAKRPFNLWRYREAIPIEEEAQIVSFDEGGTPLLPIQFKDGTKALIKQEYLFPSGSYKDRGSSVLITQAKFLGIQHLVQDSSGNAGASIATYAQKAKIPCDIYVPADTSVAKTTQIAAMGAQIIKVAGNRKETAAMAFEAAKKSYYASHCFNPYFFHGTKTIAYEICEQLNWKSPDSIVLPAGNGTLILGAYIGFKELAELGIISKIPKIIGIQSRHCNPLFKLLHNPSFDLTKYVAEDTLAEGIAIPNPIRAKEMMKAITETKGNILQVSESEIKEAWKEMASLGFFIEPTSAACIAGLNQYLSGLVQPEICVSLFSGNGLKSIEKISKILNIY
ncbi:MAG: threonine synthase [Bacteroidia bacterium]